MLVSCRAFQDLLLSQAHLTCSDARKRKPHFGHLTNFQRPENISSNWFTTQGFQRNFQVFFVFYFLLGLQLHLGHQVSAKNFIFTAIYITQMQKPPLLPVLKAIFRKTKKERA